MGRLVCVIIVTAFAFVIPKIGNADCSRVDKEIRVDWVQVPVGNLVANVPIYTTAKLFDEPDGICTIDINFDVRVGYAKREIDRQISESMPGNRPSTQYTKSGISLRTVPDGIAEIEFGTRVDKFTVTNVPCGNWKQPLKTCPLRGVKVGDGSATHFVRIGSNYDAQNKTIKFSSTYEFRGGSTFSFLKKLKIGTIDTSAIESALQSSVSSFEINIDEIVAQVEDDVNAAVIKKFSFLDSFFRGVDESLYFTVRYRSAWRENTAVYLLDRL